MFVVTVLFEIKPEHTEAFGAAVLAQARNSLDREPDCHRFDICVDPENDARVFLYEIYSDEAAFQAHLKSDHFIDFDGRVKDWVISKTVNAWRLSEG